MSFLSEHVKNPLPDNAETAIKELLQGKIAGWLVLKLFKTSLFKENNLSWIEGLNMCEDLLIALKAFYQAKKIAYIDKPLYHYNKANETSLSAKLNENKVEQLLRVVEKVETFLTDKNSKCYEGSLQLFKSRIKIWIIKDSEKLFPKYLELYDDCRLWQDKVLPLHIRFFHYVCHFRSLFLVKIVLKLK